MKVLVLILCWSVGFELVAQPLLPKKKSLEALWATNAVSAGGIAFRSSTDYAAGGFNGTSFALNKPSGTVSGDVLVLFVTTDSAHNITNLAGFTLRESSILGNSGFSCATLAAGGSEPASYTFEFDAGESGVATLLCYSGVNAAPFDLDAINSGAPGAGSPHTTAPVTPGQNNSMIVGCIFIDPAGTPGYTDVGGYNLRSALSRNANAGQAVADKLQTTATSEGVQIIEDAGGTWGQYTLAIKP